MSSNDFLTNCALPPISQNDGLLVSSPSKRMRLFAFVFACCDVNRCHTLPAHSKPQPRFIKEQTAMPVAPSLEKPSMPAVEIDTAVTPSLHKRNIEAIEGYGPDTSGYVAKALEAFEAAYTGLSAIHKARQAADKDPTLTPEARLLRVADFAERHQVAITKRFDAAHDVLTKAIDSNESMLSEPLRHKAERPGVASEVRAHVKALTVEQRGKWFTERLKEKDYESLEIVLGAGGYLSGMSDDERRIRTRMYHELKSPDVAKRLKVMTQSLELVHARGPLLWKEIELAVGASPMKIKKLRSATTETEKAFLMRDKSAA